MKCLPISSSQARSWKISLLSPWQGQVVRCSQTEGECGSFAFFNELSKPCEIMFSGIHHDFNFCKRTRFAAALHELFRIRNPGVGFVSLFTTGHCSKVVLDLYV